MRKKQTDRWVDFEGWTLILSTDLLQTRMTALKEKRVKKEEKARYEKMAETMHKKRVERLKRKEKRNKMLKS
jgi:hypothetical protein